MDRSCHRVPSVGGFYALWTVGAVVYGPVPDGPVGFKCAMALMDRVWTGQCRRVWTRAGWSSWVKVRYGHYGPCMDRSVPSCVDPRAGRSGWIKCAVDRWNGVEAPE